VSVVSDELKSLRAGEKSMVLIAQGHIIHCQLPGADVCRPWVSSRS
jgi:hypothetical protein